MGVTAGKVSKAAAPPAAHAAVRTPGAPLDAAARAYFEPRFGHDFSAVRVHADGEAAASAAALNAAAYAVGNHLVFAADQFAPHTPGGQHLLAHELAHVVQAAAAGPASSVASLEGEATRVAAAVRDGRAMPAVGGSANGVGVPLCGPPPAGAVVPLSEPSVLAVVDKVFDDKGIAYATEVKVEISVVDDTGAVVTTNRRFDRVFTEAGDFVFLEGKGANPDSLTPAQKLVDRLAQEKGATFKVVEVGGKPPGGVAVRSLPFTKGFTGTIKPGAVQHVSGAVAGSKPATAANSMDVHVWRAGMNQKFADVAPGSTAVRYTKPNTAPQSIPQGDVSKVTPPPKPVPVGLEEMPRPLKPPARLPGAVRSRAEAVAGLEGESAKSARMASRTQKVAAGAKVAFGFAVSFAIGAATEKVAEAGEQANGILQNTQDIKAWAEGVMTDVQSQGLGGTIAAAAAQKDADALLDISTTVHALQDELTAHRDDFARLAAVAEERSQAVLQVSNGAVKVLMNPPPDVLGVDPQLPAFDVYQALEPFGNTLGAIGYNYAGAAKALTSVLDLLDYYDSLAAAGVDAIARENIAAGVAEFEASAPERAAAERAEAEAEIDRPRVLPDPAARDKQQQDLLARAQKMAPKQPPAPPPRPAPQPAPPPSLVPVEAPAPAPQLLPGAPTDGPAELAAKGVAFTQDFTARIIREGNALVAKGDATEAERAAFRSNAEQWRLGIKMQMNSLDVTAMDWVKRDQMKTTLGALMDRDGPTIRELRLRLNVEK